MSKLLLIAADAILIAHALVVLFNVATLPIIWLGHALKWKFIRNFTYRTVHLLLVGFVTVQTVAGEICPLTTWENELRVRAGADAPYATSFVAHWVHRLIFCEAEQWVFAVAYLLFLGLVGLTFFFIPPDPPAWWRKR